VFSFTPLPLYPQRVNAAVHGGQYCACLAREATQKSMAANIAIAWPEGQRSRAWWPILRLCGQRGNAAIHGGQYCDCLASLEAVVLGPVRFDTNKVNSVRRRWKREECLSPECTCWKVNYVPASSDFSSWHDGSKHTSELCESTGDFSRYNVPYGSVRVADLTPAASACVEDFVLLAAERTGGPK
jgi:hypothetical protein